MASLTIIMTSCKENTRHVTQVTEEAVDESTYFYGIKVDSLNVIEEKIAPNDFLANMLMNYRVDYNTIHQITQSATDIFDFRRLKAGQNYYVLHSDDSLAMPEYFIFDKSAYEYIVCDIRNSVCVYAGKKPIRTEHKIASGVIDHSLYLTLDNNNIHPTLALSMADIYAWTIDFYHLQKGDRFKVIYQEEYVDSHSLGVSLIESAVFEHYDKELYASRYKLRNDSIHSYFDEVGASLQKTFLKSPLKFGRLTSSYSGRRFHPVQKRYKAHRGTDYAAATGTPIRSTADGVVVEAAYKKYNGYYVKVKHNSMYMTQYLHMSKFAKGIKPGRHVQQGETIGYVGSTGLATGPHVCYRFWKHGSQIDHTKEEVPPSDPVPEEELEEYLDHFKGIREGLLQIEYPEPVVETTSDSLVADIQ
ncbi:MAG: peptidoglycan DD-metalloendopeptidase family protein [Bacteroidetes bacterium]|nr:peptidoglycan DD-metalloendopeptidase family protein [Bacteroidota bacterium]